MRPQPLKMDTIRGRTDNKRGSPPIKATKSNDVEREQFTAKMREQFAKLGMSEVELMKKINTCWHSLNDVQRKQFIQITPEKTPAKENIQLRKRLIEKTPIVNVKKRKTVANNLTSAVETLKNAEKSEKEVETGVTAPKMPEKSISYSSNLKNQLMMYSLEDNFMKKAGLASLLLHQTSDVKQKPTEIAPIIAPKPRAPPTIPQPAKRWVRPPEGTKSLRVAPSKPAISTETPPTSSSAEKPSEIPNILENNVNLLKKAVAKRVQLAMSKQKSTPLAPRIIKVDVKSENRGPVQQKVATPMATVMKTTRCSPSPVVKPKEKSVKKKVEKRPKISYANACNEFYERLSMSYVGQIENIEQQYPTTYLANVVQGWKVREYHGLL